MSQFNAILDEVTGAWFASAPWRLKSDYAGVYAEGQRSSDSDTEDLGFADDGGPALTDWATWYGSDTVVLNSRKDQSGNARNITQATAADKPQLVDAGTLRTGGGPADLPASHHTTSAEYLNNGTAIASDDVTFAFSVNRKADAGQGTVYVCGWAFNDVLVVGFADGGKKLELFDGTNQDQVTINGGAEFIGFGVFVVRCDLSESTFEVFKDGVSVGTGAYTNKGGAPTLGVGALPSAGQPFPGEIEALIIWDRHLDDQEVASVSEALADPTPADESGSRMTPATIRRRLRRARPELRPLLIPFLDLDELEEIQEGGML